MLNLGLSTDDADVMLMKICLRLKILLMPDVLDSKMKLAKSFKSCHVSCNIISLAKRHVLLFLKITNNLILFFSDEDTNNFNIIFCYLLVIEKP